MPLDIIIIWFQSKVDRQKSFNIPFVIVSCKLDVSSLIMVNFSVSEFAQIFNLDLLGTEA